MKKNIKSKAQPQGSNKKSSDKKSSTYRYRPPVIRSIPNGKEITHEEIIGTINGDTLFTSSSFPTNPGMMAPWLADEAKGWEQYDYKSLVFGLTSQRGDLNDGLYMVAPDYNVYDDAPEDQKSMGSFQNYAQTKITEHMKVPLNMASFFSSSKKKFVRTGFASGDLKTYDGATLFVATQGCTNPGDPALTLTVKYTVRFYVPETDSPKKAPPILDAGNLNAQNIVPETDTDVAVTQVFVNGLAAVAEGGGFRIPKGFYTILANTSCAATDGIPASNAQHSVQSNFAVYLDGKEIASSKAGSMLRDAATAGFSQAENTTLGCFDIPSDLGGIVKMVYWIGSSVVPPVALTFTIGAAGARMTLNRAGGSTG